MKILHTVHATGEYTLMVQNVHVFDHNDLAKAWNEINQHEEVTSPVDEFTTVNEHGIFTSSPELVESYVVIS